MPVSPRILLVRTDRLGDVILTLPMVAQLRHCLPDAYIAMLLRRYTGAIVEGNPYLDTLLWYDEDEALVPFGTMLRTLRKEHFDAAIVVHPTPRLALLAALAGIPVRIGTGYRYYSLLFNRRVYEHRRDAKRHELEYNLSLLREWNCTTVPAAPDFAIVVPKEDAHDIRVLLQQAGVPGEKPIVLLHPGSGGSARDWPVAGFAALAENLILRDNVAIIVTGGKGEEVLGEAVVKATGGKAVSFVGSVTLKQLAALCREAALFVGNSTGPLHIAVAVGTPVVGLYPLAPAMSARRWGPYTKTSIVVTPAADTDARECEAEHASACPCMASISVEEVYEAAHTLLEANRGREEVG